MSQTLFGSTGTTKGYYVPVLKNSNPEGDFGIGTLENTDGANSLRVRETVLDFFGVIDSVVTTLPAGNTYLLDLETNFGLGRPSYATYQVDVIDGVPGSHATYKIELTAFGTIIVPPVIFPDVLTSPGFTVPYATTVNVSGGGAALQTAINAAGAGVRLLIQDSLAYDPVEIIGKTNLVIDVVAGQTPSITAVGVGSAGVNGHCVTISAGNSGVYVRGLTLIGAANENTVSQGSNGLFWGSATSGAMASVDRLIIEDCVFQEPAPATLGAPAIQLVGTDGSVHVNIWIHRCTLKNNAAGPNVSLYGYGACTVGGFTNVFIQNTEILRENAVIVRASSSMRGVVSKNINTVVEDVLCNDLGSAGSNENFKHNDEAIFGTAVGNSQWRNCVAYQAKRGFRISLGGAVMTVTASVVDVETAGIAAGQTLMKQSAGTLVAENCSLVGAGDGTTFDAAVTESYNDVFNFLATGKVLDVTDQTIDPIFADITNRIWIAEAATLQTGASDGGLIGVRYTSGEAIFWVG